MSWRHAAGAAVVTSLAVAGAIGAVVLGPAWVLAAATAGIGLTAALAWPDRTAPAVAIAGCTSLAATLGTLPWRPVEPHALVPMSLVEVAALLMAVVLAVRRLPPRPAITVALPAVAGVGTWVLRDGSPLSTATLVGCAVWTIAAIAACAFGGYLRLLDLRRAQAVLADRREQRLHLASELHDFVAHDVSGILALAQAGRLLPADQATQVSRILQAIEQAAGSALASMDRTIRLLHEHGMVTGPTMEDLPDLIARFSAAHPAAVRIDVDPNLPREISGTAYRVIVEALTNIRRHAPRATKVDLAVRITDETATVEVVDDGGTTSTRHPRLGGLGIVSLTERVQLLGGTVEACPRPSTGWCLRAVLPLAGTPSVRST